MSLFLSQWTVRFTNNLPLHLREHLINRAGICAMNFISITSTIIFSLLAVTSNKPNLCTVSMHVLPDVRRWENIWLSCTACVAGVREMGEHLVILYCMCSWCGERGEHLVILYCMCSWCEEMGEHLVILYCMYSLA